MRAKYTAYIVLAGLLFLFMSMHTLVYAQGGTEAANPSLYKSIGAALAIGLAGIGAGYAIAIAGASGLTAVAERPEIFSNVLLVVALGEGIAIYGLIVAILILIR